MGRPRKDEGTRVKDKKAIIIKVDQNLYEKISKDGKPSDIVLELLLKYYKTLD